MTTMLHSNADCLDMMKAWGQKWLGSCVLPEVEDACSLDLKLLPGLQDDLLAPSRDLSLKVTSNLHWSSLEACQQLEQVRLCLCNNPEAMLLRRCMLSFEGCDPAYFKHDTEFAVEADTLSGNSQLRVLDCGRLRYVMLHMWEPQATSLNISHLTSAKWVLSSVRVDGLFTCKIQILPDELWSIINSHG